MPPPSPPKFTCEAELDDGGEKFDQLYEEIDEAIHCGLELITPSLSGARPGGDIQVHAKVPEAAPGPQLAARVLPPLPDTRLAQTAAAAAL